jgi:hypothetical protein
MLPNVAVVSGWCHKISVSVSVPIHTNVVTIGQQKTSLTAISFNSGFLPIL